ncbi:MAG: anthranilate synthase component I family protein [Deltaproteobacteria bacterium]|jgi:para-aminobenzoate synthetase component I|nr:anthranilate synthase component I family protein [Deltaproteobacteria bacterium]
MLKKKIHNITSKAVLRNLQSEEKNPFMTFSNSPNGWKKYLAFDPVDQCDHSCTEGISPLLDFVKKHRGKFLAGYLSYDLGYELHQIPNPKKDSSNPPFFRFAAYDNFVEFNDNQGIIFYNDPQYPTQVSNILGRDINVEDILPKSVQFLAKLEKTEYETNFNKIIDYIKAGDIYQINYTHQLEAESEATAKQLFLNLLKTNPVDFAAFWDMDDFSILSLSPESFTKIRKNIISTLPIKGTRPRGRDLKEDQLMKKELLESKKEQAELFMITDLLRNDLGKIAEIGSVKVESKKNLQTLSKVFHTYSEVSARLRENISGIEALISMFPGGSITGCPKKRAMEIIDEIESFSRGIYTGSIGYILPNQDMDFNIAIRTVVKKGEQLYLGVGGGITIGSTMADEYEETLAKAQSFFKN